MTTLEDIIKSYDSDALIKALEWETTVEIHNSNITDDGAKVIATALAWNKTVQTLDLTDNEISGDGALVLVDVFLTNTTLTDIKLPRNKGADWYTYIIFARSDPRMWEISYEQLVKVRDLAMEIFGEDFHSKTMRDVNKTIIIPGFQKEEKSYAQIHKCGFLNLVM